LGAIKNQNAILHSWVAALLSLLGFAAFVERGVPNWIDHF